MSSQDFKDNFVKGMQDYPDWTQFMRKGQAALLVIDAQNDVLKEEGNLSIWCVWKHAQENRSVDNIKSIVVACRKASIPIFWIRQLRLAGGRDVFPGTFDGFRIAFYRKTIPDFQLEGTWQVEIIDELKDLIDNKDIIIDKAGSSSFEGTNLNRYLVQLGIKTLLLCGFITSACVEATGRTGRERGYLTVLIGDACASRCEEEQRSALERYTWIIGPAVTTNLLIELLKSW